MDPGLTCIDPNLLQLLEEDDEVPGFSQISPSTNPPPSLSDPNPDPGTTSIQGPPESPPPITTDSSSTLSGPQVLMNNDDEANSSGGLPPYHPSSSSSSSSSSPALISTPATLSPILNKNENRDSKIFYFDNLLEAQFKIQEIGRCSGVEFRKRKNPKNFGYTDWKSVILRKVLFIDDDKSQEDGSKKIYVKASSDSCIYECHQGPDHDLSRKRKRKRDNTNNRKSSKNCKKIGCPFRIMLEERIYFTDYSHSKNEAQVKTYKNQLLKLFKTPESLNSLQVQRKIYLSLISSHNHPISDLNNSSNDTSNVKHSTKLSLQTKVIDKIHELVWDGIDRFYDVRNALLKWIWFENDRCNNETQILGKAVPSTKDILNHISLAKQHIQNFLKQQEEFKKTLENMVEKDDYVYFRLHYQKVKANDGKITPTINNKDSDDSSWKRIKELQKEGTVFLMNEENSVLAFGRKVPGFEGNPPENPLQWFEITEVMFPGAKTPLQNDQDLSLKTGVLTLWPNNLVLDVVVETFDAAPSNSLNENDKSDQIQEIILQDVAQYMIFIYQTKFQIDLWNKFGTQIIYVDCVLKSSRSNLVIYCFWVKTLTDYQPVGIIATEDREFKAAFIEAIELLKEQKLVLPEYLFIRPPSQENDVDMVESIEKIWSHTCVLYDDHERIKIWDSWFAINHSKCHEISTLRSELNDLASLKDLNSLNQRIEIINNTLKEFKNSSATNIKLYWENIWLQHYHRWVWACSPIRALSINRPKYYFSFNHPGYAVTSETDQHQITGRLVTFSNTLQAIIKNWFPCMRSNHEKQLALSNSCNSPNMKNVKIAFNSLKQILSVLETDSDDNNLESSHNQLLNVISNLVPLIKS